MLVGDPAVGEFEEVVLREHAPGRLPVELEALLDVVQRRGIVDRLTEVGSRHAFGERGVDLGELRGGVRALTGRIPGRGLVLPLPRRLGVGTDGRATGSVVRLRFDVCLLGLIIGSVVRFRFGDALLRRAPDVVRA